MNISKGPVPRAQKVLVYGCEGVGKSTLAAQFPQPLFIDTEGGTAQMDIARMDAPTSWSMLTGQVRWVRDTLPGDVSTLVIDTIDWAEQMCAEHVIAAHCTDSKKPVKGIEDFGYGKGFTYMAEEFGRFLNLLSDVVQRGVNVVLVAHAQIRKFEQPDASGAYDRWELKLSKKVAPLAAEWADMMLFCNFDVVVISDGDKAKGRGGSKRVMHTSHSAVWDAKNRHGLDDKLGMGFAAIAHCIPVRQAAPAPAPAPAPVPAPAPPQGPGPAIDPASFNPGPSIVLDPGGPVVVSYLRALYDLMAADGVSDHELRAAVALRGHRTYDTAVEDYPESLVSGSLVGAWPKVLDVVRQMRTAAQEKIPY
jgi:GTPase SAR1 family protein